MSAQYKYDSNTLRSVSTSVKSTLSSEIFSAGVSQMF